MFNTSSPIGGQLLQANLLRELADLQFDTDPL